MEDLANKSHSTKRKREEEEEEVVDLEEIEDDPEDKKSAQIKARKITPCIITFVQNSLDANMQYQQPFFSSFKVQHLFQNSIE